MEVSFEMDFLRDGSGWRLSGLNVALSQPVPTSAGPLPDAVAPRGAWGVQLGAFAVRANADGLWSRLHSTQALAGHPRVDLVSGRLVRLLAGGFPSKAEAQRACARLSAAGHRCLVVAL